MGKIKMAGMVLAFIGVAASASTVRLRVSGAANARGHLRIAAFTSDKGFPKPAGAFAKLSAEIAGGGADFVLENVPEGKLAVSALHDENDNGEMDYGAFGIPKESYGFSNDARGTFGPPSFAEAAVDVKGSESSFEIRLE